MFGDEARLTAAAGHDGPTAGASCDLLNQNILRSRHTNSSSRKETGRYVRYPGKRNGVGKARYTVCTPSTVPNMNHESVERLPWRLIYASIILVVVLAFLHSITAVLTPYLLFCLLVLLLVPYAGGRKHAILLIGMGILTLTWALCSTGSLIAPFVLSVVLAYLLHPAVCWLEQKKIRRELAIAILALPLILAAVYTTLVGVPALAHQAAKMVERAPMAMQAAAEWAESTRRSLSKQNNPLLQDLANASLPHLDPAALGGFVEARKEAIMNKVGAMILGAGKGLGLVLTVLSYLVLTPVLTFYLLRDYHALQRGVAELIPPSKRAKVMSFARDYDHLLSRYLRGQLMTAAAVGTLTWTGFVIVGFPNAALIGLTAGVFNLVPYLGVIAGVIPAVVTAVFSGAILVSLAKIAIVFGVVQMLEGMVLSPYFVGESVGLHPVWVILAMSVFGFFFGFTGILLAVPLAVLVKLLLREGLERYRGSALYNGAEMVERVD